jgi:hypothetical protein
MEEKEYYCCNFSQHGFYPTDPVAVEAFFLGLLLPLAAILATPTREKKESKSTPMVWARLKPLPAPKGFLEHLHPHYPISLAL